MISIQKSGDTINFTFTDSSHYLYGNGTISVPENSLTLTIDESDIVNFKKADSNDIFISATLGEFGKTKAELIEFYKENMVNAGISSGDVETMISSATSGKVDTSAFTSYSGSIESRLSEDEEVTSAALNALNETVEGKVDASAITSAVTSGSTDAEIPTAKAVYDAIPQGGGGKAVSGGTNISITTGETADTINCTLNLVNGDGTDSVKMKNTSSSNGSSSFAIGSNGVKASGNSSFAGGSYSEAKGMFSMAFGRYSITNNYGEVALGFFGKSNGSSNAPSQSSGNTLFSVGNGTANNAKHNAFEVRQNGDIYCSDGTNDVKLQDYIQHKIVQMTQSEYSAMEQAGTLDNSTLYIVIDS